MISPLSIENIHIDTVNSRISPAKAAISCSLDAEGRGPDLSRDGWMGTRAISTQLCDCAFSLLVSQEKIAMQAKRAAHSLPVSGAQRQCTAGGLCRWTSYSATQLLLACLPMKASRHHSLATAHRHRLLYKEHNVKPNAFSIKDSFIIEYILKRIGTVSYE